MRRPWTVGILVVAACGTAAAQQVPNIKDVYATDERSSFPGLGPGMDPVETLERAVEALRACDRVDYSVEVTYPGAPESGVRGAVTIGRGPTGRLDRFRFDAAGTLPGAEPIDVTVGSGGRGYYVIDRRQRTATEFDRPSDSLPFGALARQVQITGLAELVGEGTPRVERRSADTAAIHLVDDAFDEHVYAVFAAGGRLPIVIERVGPGPDGRPRVVRVRVSGLRLDDPASATRLDPVVPDGFGRVRRAPD